MCFRNRLYACSVLLLTFAISRSAMAQGVILPASGPVNYSMAGASTAAPLEAIGALYWNPATIGALPNELGFGADLLFPILETESSVAGLGAGRTGAEPGVAVVPSVGLVYRAEESPLTLGFGLVGLAGFKTNYPASLTNPAFTPQSNTPGMPGGFGRVYTEATFLQLVPAATYAVNDRLAIGFSPTVTLGQVIVDPLIPAPRNDADGSGVPRYSSGRGTRMHWGAGAQLGVYYITDNCWHLGASIKSPQWMEKIRVHSEDERGRPIVHKFNFDLPMIISLGAAYSGFERLIVAMDFRYFDYKNTDGFRGGGFRPDGSLIGLGGSNIFALSVGAQYSATETLSVRGGYGYNQQVLKNNEATLGIPAPIYYQHRFHAGASYQVSDALWINLSYSYFLPDQLTGPIVTPDGVVPGSSVTTKEQLHAGSFGATVRF